MINVGANIKDVDAGFEQLLRKNELWKNRIISEEMRIFGFTLLYVFLTTKLMIFLMKINHEIIKWYIYVFTTWKQRVHFHELPARPKFVAISRKSTLNHTIFIVFLRKLHF